MIRQEDSDYFAHDTLKDPIHLQIRRQFVWANSPLVNPKWKDADDGVEDAVKRDHNLFESTEGQKGRFVATWNWRDAQLRSIFHGLAKLENGAAIIPNGSPLSRAMAKKVLHLEKVRPVVTFLRMI